MFLYTRCVVVNMSMAQIPKTYEEFDMEEYLRRHDNCNGEIFYLPITEERKRILYIKVLYDAELDDKNPPEWTKPSYEKLAEKEWNWYSYGEYFLAVAKKELDEPLDEVYPIFVEGFFRDF